MMERQKGFLRRLLMIHDVYNFAGLIVRATVGSFLSVAVVELREPRLVPCFLFFQFLLCPLSALSVFFSLFACLLNPRS